MELLASAYDKSKYLRAEDIKGDKKFRIKAVSEGVFEKDGKPEKKPVLWFTTDDRGLVLNTTNNRTIRGAFGDPFANWIGKIIVVFTMVANFRGKMTPALRVRIPPPKQATAAAPQPAAPQQPVTSGNGAAAAAAPVAAAAPLAVVAAAAPLAAAALAVVDSELEPDPVKSIGEELDDDDVF